MLLSLGVALRGRNHSRKQVLYVKSHTTRQKLRYLKRIGVFFLQLSHQKNIFYNCYWQKSPAERHKIINLK